VLCESPASERRYGKYTIKSLVIKGSGRFRGAHLFGPHAEEGINIFALAIRTGATAADLKELTYAYPTRSSDITYMV